MKPSPRPRSQTKATDERPRIRFVFAMFGLANITPTLLRSAPLEATTEDEQQLCAVSSSTKHRSHSHVLPVGDGSDASILKVDADPVLAVTLPLYSFSKMRHGNGLQGYVDPRLWAWELRVQGSLPLAGFTGESLGVLVELGMCHLKMCDR